MKKLVFISLLCVLIGCDRQTQNNNDECKPMQLNASERMALSVTNDYSFRLLAESYKNGAAEDADRNHFVSPLSAAMVLGMLENGSSGMTQSEILETMGFDADGENTMNAYYGRMMNELPLRSKHSVVKMANSLWVSDVCPLLPSFENSVQTEYQATAKSCNFSDPATARNINGWCAQNTENKITGIVTADEIAENTLVLVNALYFKSDWKTSFDKKLTVQKPFYASENYLVDLMHNTGNYRVSRNNLFRMLEVDFKGDAYCMDFLLPADGENIESVVDNLNADNFAQALSAQREEALEIAIPRFKVSYEYIFNDALKTMGMPGAFNPDEADFSRLSAEKLYLTLVKQKSFIEVDETGATSTAATAGLMDDLATEAGKPFFWVNEPFVVILRERQSNVILFAGIISKP